MLCVPFLHFDDICASRNRRIELSWAAFRLPEATPRLRVIPDTRLDLLDRSLTWDTLRFPQDPVFSEAYRVESPEGPGAGGAGDAGGVPHPEPGHRQAVPALMPADVEDFDGHL